MAATITVTWDATYLRAGVELTGWTHDGDAKAVRVHSGGKTYPVRAMSPVIGGAAFGYDTEIPSGETVTYQATDGTTVVSVSYAVPVLPAMIRSPGMPSLDARVSFRSKPSNAWTRNAVDLEIFGGDTVTLVDPTAKLQPWTAQLLTRTVEEADRLQQLVESSPAVLIIQPGTRIPWRYAKPRSGREEPYVSWRYQTGGPTLAQWAKWEVQFTPCDRPVGGVTGDPTSSWQSLMDRHATWPGVLAAAGSWLDVLKGA